MKNCRVFQDRLVNDEDRKWFINVMKDKMIKEFSVQYEDVVNTTPLVYGDFMIPNAENKIYAQVTDYDKVFVVPSFFPSSLLSSLPFVPNFDFHTSHLHSFPQMVKILEEYLEDFNQINTAQMKLVLFSDAVQHICRVGRIIRQPLGNALLLGVGG